MEAKLLDNKKEHKDDNNKQEDGDRDTCLPTGRIFFRRDMFKKYMEEDQSISLLAEESEVKEFDNDFMEEESMNLLANIDGV